MVTKMIDGLLFKVNSPSKLVYAGYDDQIYLVYTEIKNWRLNVGTNFTYFSTREKAIASLKAAITNVESQSRL